MNQTAYQLREWLVEPSLKRITSGDRRIEIEPKSMAVLLLLIEHAGEVVSSAQIVKEVWNDRPMGDNPVYKTVAKLRRVLGDSSEKPRYIKTIPKTGYRLIAPVTVADSQNPVVSQLNQAEMGGHFQKHRIAWLTGSVVVLLAAGLFWWLGQPQQISPVTRQLVTLPGFNAQATYSPDGSQLVFVNESEGKGQLWLMDVSSDSGTAPRQLTFAHAGSVTPVWSPTGEWLVFVRDGDIWRMRLDGEPELLIEQATHPGWSHDASMLVFERGPEVWISSADGQQQKRIDALTSRSQMFKSREPAFSPKGDELVYFDNVEGPMGALWKVEIASSRITRLTEGLMIAGNPEFSEDGQWILFHAVSGGSQTLWRVPSAGGAPERMLHSSGEDSLSAVSTTQRSLLFSTTRPDWSLLVTDMNTGVSQTLFASRHPILAPELSPDKSQIAYFANDGKTGAQIFVHSLGKSVSTLLTNNGVNIMPKWSSDGQWLYFYQVGETPDWRKINTTTKIPQPIFPNWTFNKEHDVTVSPDGHELIYAQLEGARIMSTRIKDLKSGAERSLNHRLSWPDWSRDGNSLIATDFSTNSLPVGPIVLCHFPVDQSETCKTLAPRGQHPIWSSDETSVYFVEPVSDDTLLLWQHKLTDGINHVVMELSPAAIDFSPFFDVTPDGKVVWVSYGAGRSELWELHW